MRNAPIDPERLTVKTYPVYTERLPPGPNLHLDLKGCQKSKIQSITPE